MAILFAILLKPMIVEAYVIPTPSMQPTLMGAPEAGVNDRLVVDQTRYLFTDPRRWDIAVFRYPIRELQKYVKRIVGMPLDRLRIASGNLWEVGADGKIASVHRKPDRIQAGLWRELFPRRMEIDEGTDPMKYFAGKVGKWSAKGMDLVGVASGSGRATLEYRDENHGGLVNRVYDGYPPKVARSIQRTAAGANFEGVQDVRIALDLTVEQALQSFEVRLNLVPPGSDRRVYALVCKDSQAQLVIRRKGKEVAASEPIPCALTAGDSTHLSFAVLDDRLIAEVNGTTKELEIGDHRLTKLLDGNQTYLECELRGPKNAKLTLSNLEIHRDLHYVARGAALRGENGQADTLNHVIEIPEGHYLMLGDNPQQSADARDWEVVTIGVENNQIVDPKTHPNARILRGNRRPWNLDVAPDVDESPVVLRKQKKIVFTDSIGENFTLDGEVYESEDNPAESWPNAMKFRDGKDGPWFTAQRESLAFVPRKHIYGRPMVLFWPVWTMFRPGMIR